MLIVNAGSNLLFSVTRFSKYYLSNTSTSGIVAQQAWYVYCRYILYNNCIKISAVNGCSLILSASVIAEEPYYRTIVLSYYRTFVLSFVPRTVVRIVLSFVHTFIHCEPCVCFSKKVSAGCAITYSNRVNRRCSWRSGHRRYFV